LYYIGFVLSLPYNADGYHNVTFTYDASTSIAQGLVCTNNDYEYNRYKESLKSLSDLASYPIVILLASLETSVVRHVRKAKEMQDALKDVQDQTRLQGAYDVESQSESQS